MEKLEARVREVDVVERKEVRGTARRRALFKAARAHRRGTTS
jgi:hypothetical protein